MTPTLTAIAEALDLPEEELRSLRSAAMSDPVRGAPLRFTDVDGPQEIEPGGWHVDGWPDRRTGLPPQCPVTPLGSDNETFYFLNTLGQVHTLKAASSGKGPIDALFQGRSAYLEWAWPRWGKGNSIKGYEADECRRDLFDACAFKGTFELEDRVRGRGAWRDDDGSLIYHAGDQVLIGGKWKPCGELGRFIYPARPRIGRPSLRYEKQGPGSPGDAVLELLRTWNWDRGELDARLLLGWVITALVGGALEQRPIVWVVGQEGSGKSTLQLLLRLLMNDALVATSNTTQAGIYQRVRQDSIAVLVDEQEAKEDTRGGDKLLELMRISFSGDKMLRGGADHQGREFTLRSACLASSIAQPAMGAQDQSRMAVMMMRPREATAGAVDGLVDAKGLAAHGRHLLRRVFEWWPRWDALRAVFREALKAAGHEARAADTFGTLAAASHLALWDDMPTAEQLAEWGGWLKPDMLEETANREATWRRCFSHMLQAQPDVYRQAAAKRRSVGDYLAHFKKACDGLVDCEDNLPLCGLTLSFPKGEPMDFDHARLFVPAKHPALHALFAGTAWAGSLGAPGPWIGVLRQAPKELWENGKCDKGLDAKASGIFIRLAAALEA